MTFKIKIEVSSLYSDLYEPVQRWYAGEMLSRFQTSMH